MREVPPHRGVQPPSAAVLSWFAHELAGRALRAVIELLEPEGIPVLPVKGVVLARTLYADVGERPISDVDLRVRPADLGRIERLARGRGWATRHESKQWGTFEIALEQTLVELETSIGPPGVCAVGVEEMLGRASVVTGSLGFPHLEPELHDHGLVLCVNAFKDKIRDARPWALSDLVRLGAQPGFASGRMAELAARAELRAVVWVVADWAASAGGSEPWREVRDRLGRAPPRPLYVRAFRALAALPRGTGPALPLLARAASDDAALRARALFLGGAGVLSWWWARASMLGGAHGASR